MRVFRVLFEGHVFRDRDPERGCFRLDPSVVTCDLTLFIQNVKSLPVKCHISKRFASQKTNENDIGIDVNGNENEYGSLLDNKITKCDTSEKDIQTTESRTTRPLWH